MSCLCLFLYYLKCRHPYKEKSVTLTYTLHQSFWDNNDKIFHVFTRNSAQLVLSSKCVISRKLKLEGKRRNKVKCTYYWCTYNHSHWQTIKVLYDIFYLKDALDNSNYFEFGDFNLCLASAAKFTSLSAFVTSSSNFPFVYLSWVMACNHVFLGPSKTGHAMATGFLGYPLKPGSWIWL